MGSSGISIVASPNESDNWILTTVIGSEYFRRWEILAKESWLRYCSKFDIGIAVVRSEIREPHEPNLNGAWQKMLGPRALRDHLGCDVRCLLLDSDIIVSEHAENIFEVIPPGMIGVVSQEFGVPLDRSADVRKRMAFLRRNLLDPKFPLESSLLSSPADRASWAGLPTLDDYFCSGLVMTDTANHAELFSDWYKMAPQDDSYSKVDWGEELWLNSCVAARDDVVWLEYKWQALWAFEVAAYYPFVYSEHCGDEIASWCLAASLLRSNFLHLAGSWETSLLRSLGPTLPGGLDFASFAEHLSNWESKKVSARVAGELKPPV